MTFAARSETRQCRRADTSYFWNTARAPLLRLIDAEVPMARYHFALKTDPETLYLRRRYPKNCRVTGMRVKPL